MSEALVKLTVIVPAELENTLIESLLEMEPFIGAFSSMHVDGHGQSFAEATTAERVSGRAARLMVMAVLSPVRAKAVVGHIKTTLRASHSAWWVEPVLECGKFQ